MCDSSGVPDWLSALLTEKFFNACIIHEEERKNEKNVLCLDCCEGICPHCFDDHRSHRLLQIRRYVYHDVLRLGDADQLINCSQVQTYNTNGSKVVFLNQRPMSRPAKQSGSFCCTCNRTLHEPYLFCCIYCKLQDVLDCGSKVSKFLRESNNVLAIPEPGSEDGQTTPDSGITGSLETESSGSSVDLAEFVACTARTEITRKKRSNLSASGRSDIIPPAVHEIPEHSSPLTEIPEHQFFIPVCSPEIPEHQFCSPVCSPFTEIPEYQFTSPVCEISEPVVNDMIPVYKPIREISGALMKRRKCTKPQRSPLY